MSSPHDGARHCSRLSPHLAWGTLSMCEVLQAAESRLRSLGPARTRSGMAPSSPSRVDSVGTAISCRSWRASPRIEFAASIQPTRGCGGHKPERLAAWAEGRTGWPFVDACMRMLQAHGLAELPDAGDADERRLLQLWLDWRPTGLHLGRLFTDYEPGIHWPQAQMQSGTTGINTIRIYNPIKQGLDQDPDGSFIRRWCPELAAVPLRGLHTPWTMPPLEQEDARCLIGRDYPLPIVDHVPPAPDQAREAVWGVRRKSGFAAPPTTSRLGTAAAAVVCRSRPRPGGKAVAAA